MIIEVYVIILCFLVFRILVRMAPNEKIAQFKQQISKTFMPSKQKIVVKTKEDCRNNDSISPENIMSSVKYIMDHTIYRPKIAIICGSGLAGLANLLDHPDVIEYSDIPNFPLSTVPGHKSRLLFGYLSDVPIMLMQGRFHHYEGYPMRTCGMPVRIMKLFGIEFLMVTNAAGSINTSFKVGDLMIIKDHINIPGFAGKHPLNGPNDERFGSRFFALNNCYDRKLRAAAKKIAIDSIAHNKVHEGVYAMVGGPNFETVSELRMLMTCGVDAVGMSTIPEVLVANHCGITVFAFSLITNECILDDNEDEGLDHEEVIHAAKDNEVVLQKFVSRMVEEMNTVITY